MKGRESSRERATLMTCLSMFLHYLSPKSYLVEILESRRPLPQGHSLLRLPWFPMAASPPGSGTYLNCPARSNPSISAIRNSRPRDSVSAIPTIECNADDLPVRHAPPSPNRYGHNGAGSRITLGSVHRHPSAEQEPTAG
jgi:hypothetical protein